MKPSSSSLILLPLTTSAPSESPESPQLGEPNSRASQAAIIPTSAATPSPASPSCSKLRKYVAATNTPCQWKAGSPGDGALAPLAGSAPCGSSPCQKTTNAGGTSSLYRQQQRQRESVVGPRAPGPSEPHRPVRDQPLKQLLQPLTPQAHVSSTLKCIDFSCIRSIPRGSPTHRDLPATGSMPAAASESESNSGSKST